MSKSDSNVKPAIVLVADRTLSADYKALFEGIFATMQTTKVPSAAMRYFVAPAVRTDAAGRARTAPLGLRRVQSALMTQLGLSADDVVCTTPERLGDLLGPWVRIVGFSSSDPLGNGMSNTTTTQFWAGELYTRRWSRQLLGQILEAKRRWGFKVVGGGAGAWQWECYPDATAEECLDVRFEGYFEQDGPGLFRDLLDGRAVPRHVVQSKTGSVHIAPICGPSLLGIVELSRGCGRGCRFCSMAHKKMEHLPAETILADLETNIAGGVPSVVSGSEDFFRYGATGLKPNFEALRDLLERMRQLRGLSFMQIDHANITSLAQMTDEQLAEIRRLLTWEKNSKYLWVNMGAESANGHLVAANCTGKVAPYRPDDWEELLYTTAARMTRNGYFSVVSLVLGMPGETPDDIQKTLKLVKFLETQDAVVFPVFYEPHTREDIVAERRFSIATMRPEHLELYRTCYEINFKKVPLLFWDNQRCAGVSWLKRATMRVLGKTEVAAWRKAFVRVGKQLKPVPEEPAEGKRHYA